MHTIRCDYHERLECTHCSLGISHTYCYIMSEFLCSMYCVSLTRNHLPIIPQGMPTSTCYVSSERSRRTSDMASNKSKWRLLCVCVVVVCMRLLGYFHGWPYQRQEYLTHTHTHGHSCWQSQISRSSLVKALAPYSEVLYSELVQ